MNARLKRPSVMSAHSLPRPAPMMADVGVSISGIPGPPCSVNDYFVKRYLRNRFVAVQDITGLGRLRVGIWGVPGPPLSWRSASSNNCETGTHRPLHNDDMGRAAV
jgi:hypothetical protein